MVNLNPEAEQLLVEVDSIIKKLNEMNEKYGANWLQKLPDFHGSTLLKEYQEKVCQIEKFSLSKDSDDEMTHLLYHMMSQHLFSFCNVENTLNENISINKSLNPADLSQSYGLSKVIAKELNNDSKSYAWFSNMKLPTTYIGTPSVIRHYKELSKILAERPLVKVRRLHLFYESLTDDRAQLKALFTTLLVEFLMGIESKIVLVKDSEYPEYKAHFYNFKDQVTYDKGYLLDFALYHNEIRDYDGVYNDNYRSLFANFCYEKPFRGDDATIKRNKVLQYTKQKIYLIDDYNIFQVLRCYFISLWDKPDYVKYLESKKSFNPLLGNIADVYNKHLEILDIRELWKRYLLALERKEYFDERIFKLLYEVELNTINTSDRLVMYRTMYDSFLKDNNGNSRKAFSSVMKQIRSDIIALIDNIDDIYDIDLNEYFEQFIIRNEQDSLHDELMELHQLYTKKQSEESFMVILRRFINEINYKEQ